MLKKTFKYELERGSKKTECPNCNKKTFVRFINNETTEYLPSNFGRCDREQKCGYFKMPSGENISFPPPVTYNRPKPIYIPLEHVNRRFDPKREKDNNFIIFLKSLFCASKVNRIIHDYLISTCTYWGSSGTTIFWQIDEKERVRTGQLILYDSYTGKRKKKPFSHIYWYHSYLKKIGIVNEFYLRQCLFGLHLINQYSKKEMIAIVEAPKTACIMSAIFPKYLWMATCGLSNLKHDLLIPLKNKTIVLYPDLGAAERWRNKITELREWGFKIEISEFLENKSTSIPPGSDIADYFIKQKMIKSQ